MKSGFVTLLGLPNAGKSSLLNRLVGEPLAIVTPKAQTTRQLLRGHVSRPGLELVVIDTPGLQEGTKALNAAMARTAGLAASKGGDLVALVLDAADLGRRLRAGKDLGQAARPKVTDAGLSSASGANDSAARLLGPLRAILARECGRFPIATKVLPTFHKADLIRHPEHRAEIEAALLPLLAEVFASVLPPVWVSSKSGKGIDSWIAAIREVLPEGAKGELFEEETLSDKSLRELAAELVREQCFLQLGAEIPYSIAVEIERFAEEKGLARIEAVLHVERESQKAVVIGKGGAKIKAIGTKARARIEKLLGTKVFLGLKVKVTPHWAREAKWVERFGYGTRT